jgi:hypothetical protein
LISVIPFWSLHGEFSETEIVNTWFLIVDQYNAAVGESESRLALSLKKQILIKEIDIKMIKDAVAVLESIYDPYFANVINKGLGTAFTFDPENAETYLATLKKCKGRTKGFQLDLDRRKLEYAAIEARHKGDNVEPTREYFQSMLINLSDYAKYPIDDKIKTFEFCERVKRLAKIPGKIEPMNEELLSKYADRAGIESDTEFIINNLKLVKESFEALSGLRLKINGAESFGQLLQPMKEVQAAQNQIIDSTIKVTETAKKMQDQQKASIPVYDNLTDRIKKQTSALVQSSATARGSSSAYEALISQLVTNQVESDKLRREQSELKKAYDGGLISIEQYEKSLAEVKAAQIAIKVSNQDLTKALNNMEKEAQSSAGSLNELRAQLNLAQQAYDRLSEAERGTEAGGIIKKQVDDLTVSVNKLEQGTGRFGRNVGNYSAAFKGALSVLETQLADINKQMAQTGQGGAGYGNLEKQAGVLDKAIQELTKDFGSSRGALKALQEAAVQAGLAFGQTDERFLAINEAIGETINSVNDLKAATKFQSQDAKFFVGLVSAVNGLVGAFGAAQAAAGLFSDESEETQKQMAKLQQWLVLITGLQQVANTVQEESGAIQLVLAAKMALANAAKKIQTALTTTAIVVAEAEVVANTELAASEEAVAAQHGRSGSSARNPCSW